MQSGCSCSEINASTQGHIDRVGLVADAAPDCACESHSLSQYSPGIVQDEETIVRMVCVPMHVDKKKPKLLPNFFSHAFSFGMSAQRLEKAGSTELAKWLNNFLANGGDRVWLGYVQAPCKKIRGVLLQDESSRSFCVYDAASDESPAHAEVCASRRLEEADRLEARAHLMKAFSEILPRTSLMGGEVQNIVDSKLLARDVPSQWGSLTSSGVSQTF